MSGIPTVSTLHGFTGDGLLDTVYDRIARFAQKRAAAVVAVSAPIVPRLYQRGVEPGRVHLIPNAWAPAPMLPRSDARLRLGIDPHAFVVGWVGRVSREKGADILLAAMRLFDSDEVTCIMGDGPERAALESATSDLEVRWAGPVPAAASLFSAFDVLALSSRTEGTPMVLLEAMSAGLPIVATRVGGVPHMLSDAEALIVPPEDPPSLAAAIRDVRARPADARKRAEAARARFERDHAPDAWVTRHLELYRSVAP